MKIITIPDIHGRVDKMKPYFEQIETADLLILAGDLTNGDFETAEMMFQILSKHTEKILTIPGNMDTEAIVQYTEELGYNIHRSHRIIDGISFVGVGGALPFAGQYVYSESELANIMDEAVQDMPDLPQILICHQPPINTLNDRLYDGRQVGSQTVRDYIEKHQPLICFTGHIHEAIGIDHIGKTAIVNPGPVWKGYATTEIMDGEITSLTIENLT